MPKIAIHKFSSHEPMNNFGLQNSFARSPVIPFSLNRCESGLNLNHKEAVAMSPMLCKLKLNLGSESNS
jgi:hypothetical protein